MATPQYVFHMDGLTKAYAGGKKVFENIRLSFLPGVKIGVVGVNGSGKSSLLRIMAGQDKDFGGEAWAARGVTVGYLPQEPELDPALDVRGNVMEGVAGKRALLDRYNEVAMQVAEDYSDELMEEMTALQDRIDAGNLWDLDAQVDVAMEAVGAEVLQHLPAITESGCAEGLDEPRIGLAADPAQRHRVRGKRRPLRRLERELRLHRRQLRKVPHQQQLHRRRLLTLVQRLPEHIVSRIDLLDRPLQDSELVAVHHRDFVDNDLLHPRPPELPEPSAESASDVALLHRRRVEVAQQGVDRRAPEVDGGDPGRRDELGRGQIGPLPCEEGLA